MWFLPGKPASLRALLPNANLEPLLSRGILLSEYLPSSSDTRSALEPSVSRDARSGERGGMSRTPDSPTDLPKESWLATLKRTLLEFKEDKLNHWAAALTFYAVLSLFPALLVMVALVGLFADPQTVTKFLTDVIGSLGPASAVDTFRAPIESITSNPAGAGFAAIVGVAAALWSASGYVSAFTDASNVIYEVDEGRPFWKLKPLQLLVTFVTIVLVAITVIALIVSGPLARAVGDAIGLSDVAVTAWQWGKWPVMLGLVLVILHVLYFVAPNARIGRKWVSGGAVLTLVVWILASVAFAFYVGNFGSYDKVYGTMGGVVVFLLWLWITNMAVLLGVEFNAETERTRELHAGVSGAEEELKLPERERRAERQAARTA